MDIVSVLIHTRPDPGTSCGSLKHFRIAYRFEWVGLFDREGIVAHLQYRQAVIFRNKFLVNFEVAIVLSVVTVLVDGR